MTQRFNIFHNPRRRTNTYKSNVGTLVAAGRIYRLRCTVRYVRVSSSNRFHRARNYRIHGSMYTNSLLLKIYFVSSCSYSSSGATFHGRSSCSQWPFFQRNGTTLEAALSHRERSLNFPLFPPPPPFFHSPLLSSPLPANIHFASISTFTPRCVFFA